MKDYSIITIIILLVVHFIHDSFLLEFNSNLHSELSQQILLNIMVSLKLKKKSSWLVDIKFSVDGFSIDLNVSAIKLLHCLH